MTQALKLLNILLITIIPLGFLNTIQSPFAGGKFVIFQFILGIFLTCFAIEIFDKKQVQFYKPQNSKLFNCSILTLALCLIYTLFSQTPVISLFGSINRFMGMYTYSLVFLVFFLNIFFIPNTSKKSIQKKLLKSLIITANIAALYGIFQSFGVEFFFAKFNSNHFHGRIFSLSGNPSFFGQFLAISSLCTLFYNKKHWYYKASFILQFSALILTSTRASFIAFILGLIIMNVKTLKKHFKKYLILIALVSCIFIASNFKQITSLNSLQSRSHIWSSTIELIKQKPLGYGLENIETFFPLTQTPEFNIYEDNIYKTVDKIHNQPLSILYSSGIIGFFTFLYFIFLIIQNWFKETSPQKKLVYTLVIVNLIQNLLNFFDLSTLLILAILLSLQISTKTKSQINYPKSLTLIFLTLGLIIIQNASTYTNGLYQYRQYKQLFYTNYAQSQNHLAQALNYLPNQINLWLELGYSNLNQRLKTYEQLHRLQSPMPHPKIWLAKAIEDTQPQLANNIFTSIHKKNPQNPIWLLELLLHQQKTNNPQYPQTLKMFKEMFKTIWEPPFSHKDRTFIRNFPQYEKLKNTQ